MHLEFFLIVETFVSLLLDTGSHCVLEFFLLHSMSYATLRQCNQRLVYLSSESKSKLDYTYGNNFIMSQLVTATRKLYRQLTRPSFPRVMFCNKNEKEAHQIFHFGPPTFLYFIIDDSNNNHANQRRYV